MTWRWLAAVAAVGTLVWLVFGWLAFWVADQLW